MSYSRNFLRMRSRPRAVSPLLTSCADTVSNGFQQREKSTPCGTEWSELLTVSVSRHLVMTSSAVRLSTPTGSLLPTGKVQTTCMRPTSPRPRCTPLRTSRKLVRRSNRDLSSASGRTMENLKRGTPRPKRSFNKTWTFFSMHSPCAVRWTRSKTASEQPRTGVRRRLPRRRPLRIWLPVPRAESTKASVRRRDVIILDLSPFLTQSVKTQNPLNGELSHGDLSQAVHSGVQVGRRTAARGRGFVGRGGAGVGSQPQRVASLAA